MEGEQPHWKPFSLDGSLVRTFRAWFFGSSRGEVAGKGVPVSEFHELRQFSERVRDQEFRTVLDVGANVGETTRMFRRLWPQAQVYAIEPVQSTFDRLRQELSGDRQGSCFRLALGEKEGPARILSAPFKMMNHIV